MASDTPGSGAPSPDQPATPDAVVAPDPMAAPVGEWPAELVPPESPPAAPVQQPVVVPEPAPEPAVVPESAATPQWGAPPPVTPPAQPPAAGGWAAAAPPPPQAAGSWGSPPPQQQPASWAPQAGAPGGPPATWDPQPAKSNHGCLKACLVVGAIIVVVTILFFVALTALGMKFASDIGLNSDGSLQGCELVSNQDLASVLGGEPQVLPMRGLADATIGQVLDKRVLADAPDCWLIAGDASGITGRLARQESGDASAIFRSERDSAGSGGYLAADMDGTGDEAFCTGVSDAMSVGALVRSGGRLAFVSLIDGSGLGTDLEAADNGVMTSRSTCELAGRIALEMLR